MRLGRKILDYQKFMKYEELSKLVIEWGESKGILDSSTALRQLDKTQEELDETRAALKKLNDVFTQGSDSYLYVVTFILGAILGVITFSRVIKWLFKNFENRTLIVLIGFILGSVLNIVPYKTEDNESITSFLNFFKNDFSLVLWVFLGFVTIIILNIISKKNEK